MGPRFHPAWDRNKNTPIDDDLARGETDPMPSTKSFSKLRDEARRDPGRARRIDSAKRRALQEIATYRERNS